MRMNKADFEKYVKECRKSAPSYHMGRNVVILSEYSKKGMDILNRGSCYEGTELFQVYNHCSAEKRKAFDDLYRLYADDAGSNSFSICSHNSYMFTVSWLNDEGMVFFTDRTFYLVLINE